MNDANRTIDKLALFMCLSLLNTIANKVSRSSAFIRIT